MAAASTTPERQMRATVHIGTTKTGTTSIQHFLHANRGLLLEQGCLYPQCLLHPVLAKARGLYHHNLLAMQLMRGAPDRYLAPLRSELAAAADCRQLLISAENFSAYMQHGEQLGRLQAFLRQLGCSEVHIVVWLRESGAWFASMCSESLRAGEHAEHHLQPPRDNPQYRFWLDYRALLQRWSAAFGREALIVRLFEHGCLVQGDLLHDAAEAFDLRWDERFTLPPRVNESLNLLEMELLRVLNNLLPGATYNAQGSPKARLYEVLHRHLGALEEPALSFVPPRATVQAWQEWAAEGNEWVRREFFPGRTALFAPAPEQPENHELTRMTPGCWEALGRALADLSSDNFRLHRQLQLARHDLQELRGGGPEAADGSSARPGAPAAGGSAPSPAAGGQNRRARRQASSRRRGRGGGTGGGTGPAPGGAAAG